MDVPDFFLAVKRVAHLRNSEKAWILFCKAGASRADATGTAAQKIGHDIF